MNSFEPTLHSQSIIVTQEAPVMSKCAISEIYEIALPLRNYEIVLIKIHEGLFTKRDFDTHSLEIISVEKTDVDTAQTEYPDVCGDRLCSMHRNLHCAKSDIIFKSLISEKFLSKETISIIDVDYSPLSKNGEIYLLAITVYGTCFIIHRFSFSKPHINLNMFLIENLSNMLEDNDIKIFELYSLLVLFAKWYQFNSENGEFFISVIFKITNILFDSLFVYVVLGFNGIFTLISCTFLNLNPTILRNNPFLFKDMYFSVICSSESKILLILSDKNNKDVHTFTSYPYLIDIQLYHNSDCISLVMFYSNKIFLKYLQVEIKENIEIIFKEFKEIKTKSSSEIIGGFFTKGTLCYINKRGCVFLYNISSDQHKICFNKNFKNNKIITNILYHDKLPTFFMINCIGNMRNFSAFHTEVEAVTFGDFSSYIHDFVNRFNNISFNQKLSFNSIMIFDIINFIKDILSEPTSYNMESISNLSEIIKWRSKYFLCLYIFNNSSTVLQNDFFNIIIRIIKYYRILLLKNVTEFTRYPEVKEYTSSLLKSIKIENRVDFTNQYLDCVILLILKNNIMYYTDKKNILSYPVKFSQCYICKSSSIEYINYQHAKCHNSHMLSISPLSFRILASRSNYFCKNCKNLFEHDDEEYLKKLYGPLKLCPFCISVMKQY